MISKRPIENICFIGTNETALYRQLKAYCLLTQDERLREFEYMLRLQNDGITYVNDIGIIVSKNQRFTQDVQIECDRIYTLTKQKPVVCIERIETVTFDVIPTRCFIFATCFGPKNDDTYQALTKSPLTFDTIKSLNGYVHVKEVTT